MISDLSLFYTEPTLFNGITWTRMDMNGVGSTAWRSRHGPPVPIGGDFLIESDARIAQISMMRLSPATCQAIRSNVAKMIPEADCYLFGSRTDDTLKGGDIDLLILTPEKLPLTQISRLRRSILNQIGEQKLDLVHFTTSSRHPFKLIALENAIAL